MQKTLIRLACKHCRESPFTQHSSEFPNCKQTPILGNLSAHINNLCELTTGMRFGFTHNSRMGFTSLAFVSAVLLAVTISAAPQYYGSNSNSNSAENFYPPYYGSGYNNGYRNMNPTFTNGNQYPNRGLNNGYPQYGNYGPQRPWNNGYYPNRNTAYANRQWTDEQHPGSQ